ncbi:MAG: hypothetical protein JWM78_973 [Verrucomicrobiaceae bacterium]|nr:hypothetical protein [Verrucomicrobiaceae bacterium]
MENPTLNMPPAVQNAWQGYLDALECIREFIYTREFSDRPMVRNQATQFLMQMQAASYQWIIAPHVDYPRFYRYLYEPMNSNWGFPSPDYGYRWGFVDGAQTYRISGKRSDCVFLDIQVQPLFGIVEDAEFVKLPTKSYLIDDMQLEADGSFEIIASPNPHPGNWIKLDPEQHVIALFVRETFYDWGKAQPSKMWIDRLTDTPARPFLSDEPTLVAKIEHAARFVKFVVRAWVTAGFDRSLAAQDREFNRFAMQHIPANAGGNPLAVYHNMIFALQENEALIIEVEAPTSRYWSFATANRYLQIADFVYHQSSLNGHQARRDADGKYRFVLCKDDIGAPNWLDPVDTAELGMMQFRQFYQEQAVGLPKVTSVKSSEAFAALPAGTPFISPAQRRTQLDQRSRDVLQIYGY